MKVAIVCDWLTGIGGAERVVLELHRMYPDAPIYTSQYDPQAIDWFKDADVRTTWLQKLPKGFKKFLPILRARAFSKLDLSNYDLVISSAGAEAKGVKTGKNTTHVCYMHAPTHYYWSRYDDYLANPGFPNGLNWLARIGLKVLVGPLRKWDYRAAQNPDYIIANSNYTKTMIKKYYGRDSEVIHPPVDTSRFQIPDSKRNGFVVAGRQTPYKRIDLAVSACSDLGLPLTVIGNGPDHQKLIKMAGPTITFITNANDQQVAEHFAQAEAFIFPNLDDFGITPVEAMAAGTPVIAYQAGGALDYVTPGITGEFFPQQSIESLKNVLQKFNSSEFDATMIRSEVQKFSVNEFQTRFKSYISNIGVQ